MKTKTRLLSVRELQAFLRGFETTLEPPVSDSELLQEDHRLLKDFEEIHANWEERQISVAEGFNVLRTMGLTRKELCHSDILAWLLDHHIDGFGTHAQRNRGFRLFLQRVNLPLGFAEADYRVVREASGEESRLDIRIEAKNKFVIGIENKVTSEEIMACEEGKNQTEREWADLKRRGKELSVPSSGIKAFFLTPDNQAPQSRKFKAISWGQIADVFEDFAAEAKPPMVQLFAQHYAETLRRDVVSETKTGEEENERTSQEWTVSLVDPKVGAGVPIRRRHDLGTGALQGPIPRGP